MPKLEFIEELIEARMFFGPGDVKGMKASEIAECVYLIIMLIEVVRYSEPRYTSNYAAQTMSYNTYENMHYSGTDLGNLLAVLNNQDTFSDRIKVDKNLSIPLFQINRYLQSVRGDHPNHSEDATFFYRLEDYLKLYSTSVFRQLRRDIGNWGNLNLADKKHIILMLRREFDKRMSNADIYLWFKQSFRLHESIDYLDELTLPKASWHLLNAVDKQEVNDQLIALVQNAYASAPRGSFVNSIKDVLPSDWLVIELNNDDKIDAAIFYRKARANEAWSGYKIQGIGHNGQKASKDSVVGKVKSLIRTPGWWIECGVALRSSLMQHNARMITDEKFLKQLFPGSKFTMISPGTYVRTLEVGETTPESVFGNPILRHVLEALYNDF